jgi:hypothetical protein
MAIKATFLPTAGLLSELGDGVDNTIVTSRDAAGQLFVNGGVATAVADSAAARLRCARIWDFPAVTGVRRGGGARPASHAPRSLTYRDETSIERRSKRPAPA